MLELVAINSVRETGVTPQCNVSFKPEIVGIRVHVVPVPRLRRSTVPAAIVRYAAVSMVGRKVHLVLICIRAQGTAVAENNRPFKSARRSRKSSSLGEVLGETGRRW